MKEMTIPAVVENIEQVTDFVNDQLAEIGCPMKAQVQIDIAIDELFGNIAQYAYNPCGGSERKTSRRIWYSGGYVQSSGSKLCVSKCFTVPTHLTGILSSAKGA